jgi:hypothetical protein
MSTLRDRFEEIDKANPEVWGLFVRFTFDRIDRGFKHYSARAVMHRLRWHTAVPLNDGSGFKINNNWVAWYVRKFAWTFPAHADFFRQRASKADR